MEINSACISIERHLKLLEIEKESKRPRKHSTDITATTYGMFRHADSLFIETDDDSIKLLADELSVASKATAELALELEASRNDVENLQKENQLLNDDYSNLNSRGFWSRVFNR